MFLTKDFSILFKDSRSESYFIIVVLSFVASIVIFYFNHKTSFELNYQEDLKGRVNIGILMFMPYARIIPMHLIIIFAGSILSGNNINFYINGVLVSIFSILTMLFFLSMKTVADVVMHKIEHNYLRKNTIVNNSEIIIKN
jgi:hypothetical protein